MIGPTVSRVLAGVLALLAVIAGVAAQDSPGPNVLPNSHPSHREVLPCLSGTNYETDKYQITKATVDDPFDFLRWIGRKRNSVENQIAALFKENNNDNLFRYELVDEKALAIIENARFVPDDARGFLFVRIEKVSVQNCDPQAKTLELIYRIYSTYPPRFLGGAAEAQGAAKTAPQSTTGLTRTGNPVQFTPSGGYNGSDGVFGGGRIVITPKLGKFRLFDTLAGEGSGSNSLRTFSLALKGSVTRQAWLNNASWRLNYQNDSAPSGAARLKRAALSGQIDGATRPFWNGNVLARFGGLLQGGNMQSNVPAGLLSPRTLSSSGFGSLKAYVGLSSRATYNVFSASYGLELGTVGPSASIDWRKHIGDVVDEFWIPLCDHKPLEVESRFTFGGIQVPHAIPLAARFFGGNGETAFIPGDSWQIRDAPVIRAIPSKRFYLTADGAGADRFTSINLTVSFPVVSRPIMPKDLSADPEFDKLLKAQIVSATSNDQNYYTWKDPHFGEALKKTPSLRPLLDTLQKAVDAAQAAHPGKFEDEFTDCSAAVGTAVVHVKDLLAAKPDVTQYGDLAVLLPADSDDLKAVNDSCVVELNAVFKDATVGAAAAAVDSVRTAMVTDFNAIDQDAAAAKAAADIAFVKRTLNTIFKDFNIFSVSPVAVFDTAWIGPAKGIFGGRRIGPGGGVRFELASSVNFTAGYAWNVNRQPGEGKGALFFTIGIRDLFH